jgi:hypothetical protein
MVTTWLARWATFSVTGAAPLAMAHPKRSRLCLYRGQRGEKGDFCGVIANRHVQQGLPLFPVGTDLLRFGILLGIVLQVVLRIFHGRLPGSCPFTVAVSKVLRLSGRMVGHSQSRTLTK